MKQGWAAASQIESISCSGQDRQPLGIIFERGPEIFAPLPLPDQDGIGAGLVEDVEDQFVWCVGRHEERVVLLVEFFGVDLLGAAVDEDFRAGGVEHGGAGDRPFGEHIHA